MSPETTIPPPESCRVLHVLGRLARGGAELRTLEVIRHVASQGICSDVLVLSGKSGELDEEVVRYGGRVIPLARSWGWQRRLSQVLKEGDYAAVHSHVHHFSGWLLRTAHEHGIPVCIAQFHSLDDGKGDGLLRRAYRWQARRLIDRHATVILGVSRSVLEANWPSRSTDPRCRVIYNGVDMAAFSHVGERAEMRRSLFGDDQAMMKIVIHVGNVTPPKNHGMILDIFSTLAGCRPDVHLVLVGGGSGESVVHLQEKISASPHASRVHFLGSRSDVPALLMAADVFLFPSTREGLPGALVEACAAGLPSVSSDIGPCREVAERIPLVRYLSLAEPLATWASTLSACLDQPHRLSLAEAEQLVIKSGFDVAGASQQYAMLWRGGSPR